MNESRNGPPLGRRPVSLGWAVRHWPLPWFLCLVRNPWTMPRCWLCQRVTGNFGGHPATAYSFWMVFSVWVLLYWWFWETLGRRKHQLVGESVVYSRTEQRSYPKKDIFSATCSSQKTEELRDSSQGAFRWPSGERIERDPFESKEVGRQKVCFIQEGKVKRRGDWLLLCHGVQVFYCLSGALSLLSLGPMSRGTSEGVLGRQLLKISRLLTLRIVNVNFYEWRSAGEEEGIQKCRKAQGKLRALNKRGSWVKRDARVRRSRFSMSGRRKPNVWAEWLRLATVIDPITTWKTNKVHLIYLHQARWL